MQEFDNFLVGGKSSGQREFNEEVLLLFCKDH